MYREEGLKKLGKYICDINQGFLFVWGRKQGKERFENVLLFLPDILSEIPSVSGGLISQTGWLVVSSPTIFIFFLSSRFLFSVFLEEVPTE